MHHKIMTYTHTQCIVFHLSSLDIMCCISTGLIVNNLTWTVQPSGSAWLSPTVRTRGASARNSSVNKALWIFQRPVWFLPAAVLQFRSAVFIMGQFPHSALWVDSHKSWGGPPREREREGEKLKEEEMGGGGWLVGMKKKSHLFDGSSES